MDFNVTLGTALDPLDEPTQDRVLDALASAHVGISASTTVPAGMDVTLTIPAAGVHDAIRIAELMADSADLGTIESIEVLSTATFDRLAAQAADEHADREKARRAAGPIPELVSVTTAAELLGVSRPTVINHIGKTLEGRHVDGPGYVITLASVEAARTNGLDR